jgi:N-succinyldiaminopimelate aminotransferase
MPRFPPTASASAAPATVFDQVNAIVARVAPPDLVRLDMGDTCRQPPPEGRPTGLDTQRWRDYNLYSDTRGLAPLRELLAQKLRDRNGLDWARPEGIQVTCGAVHALFAAFKTLLGPGEEVLVLAPRWPLISGVIRQAGGVPVDLPFYLALLRQPDLTVEELLAPALGPRTAAIYLNSPNNPSGAVLGMRVLTELAAFAARHGLWIISDEAYEDFVYEGDSALSIASLPGMRERTVSVFTFSKCLAAAGYRVGYALAEPGLLREINRCVALTVYNPPTAHQQLAIQALESWPRWFPQLKAAYRGQRDLLLGELARKLPRPAAGFYAFIDVRGILAGRAADEGWGAAALALLEELIAAGVALLPGEAFGHGFEGWLRACFVAEAPERLRLGAERINRVFARHRS